MMYSLWIVDDEKMNRESLVELVAWAELGYEVTGVFRDGVDCIAQLQIRKPDVILTDVVMENTDGVGLARYVSLNNFPIQIIFMSAYQEFEFARKAMAYGVIYYCVKPISLSELYKVLSKIRAQLDGQRLQEPRSKHMPNTNLRDGTSIKRVMQYIEDHYQEDISLETISRELHFNPGYISRMLKEQTGENFTSIVTKKRVALAVWYLENSNLCVYEIASRVGYPNTKYFYAIFKKITGRAPNNYRSESDEREN